MKEIIILLKETLEIIRHIELLIQFGGILLIILVGLNLIINLFKRR